MTTKHHFAAGTLATGPYALDLAPEQAGWTYSGLRILPLAAGAGHSFDTGDDEVIVLPLEGGGTVDVDGRRYELAGRPHVFAGPTDCVYAPIGSTVTVTSTTGGRYAVCTARATSRYPARYLAASDVPVLLRGAGN